MSKKNRNEITSQNTSSTTENEGYSIEEAPQAVVRSASEDISSEGIISEEEQVNEGVTLPETSIPATEIQESTTSQPDVEEEEAEPGFIRLSKDTLELCEGTQFDVQIETNLEAVDVISSNEEIAGAERMGKCIRIFGMKKGRTTITVKGLDKQFETVYDELVVQVKEEILLETKIEVSDKTIVKVGSSRVIKLPGYKDISVESLTDDKVSIRIENDDIIIKGLEQTDEGKVKITATKAPFVAGYKVINVIVLGKDAIDPELDPNLNRGVVMSVNGYTQSDAFVEKCLELFTNEANYKLSTQIRADLTNRFTNQSIRNSRIIIKNLIKDTIRRTYSRVKFSNDTLAKSYIHLVCTLDYSSYGENVTNIQKKGIIDAVLLAHTAIKKEIEQALNIK